MTYSSAHQCGATNGGLVCDLEIHHPGDHRGYNAQIDEPMFWSYQNTRELVKSVRDELTEALGAGALWNPREFDPVMRNGANAFLRWRDNLDAALKAMQ